MLREISKDFVPVLEVRISDPEGKAHAAEVKRRASQTEDLLTSIPNVMQLQDEDRYWRALSEQYSTQRKTLTTRAAAIEKDLRQLDTEQVRWQATSEQIHGTAGLEVVAERVRRQLEAIQKLRAEAQEQLNQILTLQNRISEQDKEISAVLQKLDEARERLRGRIFERDSHPLWAARELRASDQSITTVLYVSAGRGFTGAPMFLSRRKTYLLGTMLVYALALLAAFRFKQHIRENKGVSEEASRTFVRPYSVAVLITLLTTIGITASAPTGVSFVVCLFYLVPVLRLLPALTKPEMWKAVYALCAFYVLEWIHLVLQFKAAFKREAFAIIILIALLVFGWLTRAARLNMRPVSGWRQKLLLIGIRTGLVLLAISLGANILGFVSLSQIFGVGTLFCAFTFVLLYTTVRVIHLGLVTILNSNWFQTLSDNRSDMIERWGWRVLVAGATLVWLNLDLYLFTVRDAVLDALKSILNYPLGVEKFHITLGETLSLALFLFLGYAIANAARFLLEKIVLPKSALQGGPAYAISRVTYYILLVGLFFAALADAGLELNKFTVITGALGLGVGFGLQNIVNNFASGLIILFERPFRVGDIVEVAGITGTVRRIGARSSTVLTFQGAEVIVPNSNLLSNQIINWTLSSPRRRVEIPVGVSYGTDPELVLKLLIKVATSNSRVLSYPPPESIFMGFGDSALNFELRFWAAQNVWFELKSEAGIAVFRSLREAGIEIPFPQRDLHLRSLDALATKELTEISTGNVARKAAGGR